MRQKTKIKLAKLMNSLGTQDLNKINPLEHLNQTEIDELFAIKAKQISYTNLRFELNKMALDLLKTKRSV